MMAANRKKLPVLPLKNTVVYPQIIVPLAVGRTMSLAAVNAALDRGRELVTVAQREPDEERPERAGLYDVGTVVTITRIEKRDHGAQIIVQGLRRVRLGTCAWDGDQLIAEIEPLPELSMDELGDDEAPVDALLRENLELAQSIARMFD